MKKIILIAAMVAGLMGNDVAAIAVDTNMTTIEANASVEVNASKPTVSKEEGLTLQKAVVYAATPVFIAGAVVAAIVISPVYLLKKVFGNNK